MRVLLVLIAGFTSLSCATEVPAPPKAERPSASSARSPWVEVRDTKGLSLLDAPAQVVVAAGAEASLSSPYAARILAVHARVGDRVEAGAPLFDVVMPEVVDAAGKLRAANLRIEVHGKRKAQLEALSEHGLTRLSDLAEVEGALGEARAEKLMAESILGAAGVQGADAIRQLASSGVLTIRSPIAGVLVAVDAPLGSVREASGAPLARVIGEGQGRVVARLAGPLPDGASLRFVRSDGSEIPLRLVSTSPLVDRRDGSRELFLDPEEPIPSGASGVLRVSIPEGMNAVAIPTLALMLSDGKAYVYRRSGEEAQRVPVRVLTSSGTDAIVVGELRVGDEVASDAVHFGAGQAP